jgi:hypothetical protein
VLETRIAVGCDLLLSREWEVRLGWNLDALVGEAAARVSPCSAQFNGRELDYDAFARFKASSGHADPAV